MITEDLIPEGEVIQMDKFVPRDYQREFVIAMETGGFKKAVLAWPRRCIEKDVWVHLFNGSTKKICDIKVGEKILSWNGKSVEVDVVKHIWKTEPKDMVRIKAGKFLPVITSIDHKFAAVNPATENVHWKKAEELNEMSHYLMNYSGFNYGKAGDTDLAEFIGYMSSDGNLNPKQQPSFVNINIEILDRVEFLAKKIFKAKVIKKKVKGTAFILNFSRYINAENYLHNPIKDFFKSNGQCIQKKYRKMNPLVWEMDFQSVKRYLAGIISGDGSLYIHENGFVSKDRDRHIPPAMELSIHCGINDEFGWNMYWLLRKFGIIPNIPKKERGSNWKIRISNSAGLFKILNDNYIYGKNDIALKILSRIKKHDFNKTIKGCYKSQITKITRLDKSEELYDIETEKNHNFFANGYLVHNSGKDVCSWNLLIRAAIREPGSYIYCLPSFSMCRRVLLNSRLHDGSSFMDFIPKKLIKAFNQQEMKITLINGSIIIMIGSDNAKERVVGMSAKGLVISEAALASPIGISYLQPMITASDGFIIFISCVAPNTIVITNTGLKRIKNISKSRKEYTELNKGIFGLEGFHNATDFYYGGKVPTLKIKLNSGFEIECSKVHKLWTGFKWKKSVNFKVNDYLPIQYNQQIFGKGLDLSGFNYKPNEKYYYKDFPISTDNIDFFYLLGLIHGDGSYEKNKVTITNKKDVEIQNFIRSVGFVTYKNDDIHFSYGSQKFTALLEFLGFKHGAKNKVFPEKLLECTKEQLKAFIQGLFDSDGSNSNKEAEVHIDSACISFVKTLQIVLLNFGIVSALNIRNVKPTKRVKVHSVIARLLVSGYFAHKFYEDIGFRLTRKQVRKYTISSNMKKGSGNTYPVLAHRLKNSRIKKGRQLLTCAGQEGVTRRKLESLQIQFKNDKYIKSLLKEELYYSKIISITESSSEVFDFVIPKTHSFFSNGFISHNTPRQENKFWELYNVAVSSDEWYSSKLTVDDTKHVPLERIQADIDSGIMSYELAQQEWWTSFTSLSEGAYYVNYIDKMELNDQFTIVPYEPSLQTYCFMDIGMDDMFVILFIQITPMTIRIFDYYENHNEGLEHYANLMKSKNYGQIIVYAPHDIAVREFNTGTSRLEKLRSLMQEVNVVPLSSINDGIEAVRTILPKTYIDNKKCAKMIKAIKNYTREWDGAKGKYKDKPNHNKYCFLGFHKVLTPKGEIPIKDIKVGDEVITPLGIRKVLETHKRRAKKLLDISIEIDCNNFITLTTTAGHKIYTKGRFVRAVSLHMKDPLEHYSKFNSYLLKKIYRLNKGDVGFKDFINIKCFFRKKAPKPVFIKSYIGRSITIIQLYFWLVIMKLMDLTDKVFNKHFVANIREYKTEKFNYVYDITVDIDHCYYIDGYLVSNSHANDALRYLAISHKKLGRGMSAEDLDERYANAIQGKNRNIPRFFQ